MARDLSNEAEGSRTLNLRIDSPSRRFVSPCGIMINDCRIKTYEIRRRSAEDQTYMSGAHFGARLAITKASKTGLTVISSWFASATALAGSFAYAKQAAANATGVR